MLKNKRSLCLDVCDYENTVLCNLYDNTSDADGQATDVFVKSERNGWKELSFSIPSTCIGEDGMEENYRLQYLISDYRIRLKTETETDWFLISEARITHNSFSKDVDVVAGHVCQLLKTKNLGLEFSDNEGNNVGTAGQFLETILKGTGWTAGTVHTFLEDDGVTEKVRSLSAPTKTGAFKLIADMCDKFDAKPIYHGDTKTVDILPLNPFSKTEEGQIPEEVKNGAAMLELCYDRNVKNITRTLNSENIVTRLYAYGSYGEIATGLCSLQTCKHKERTYTFDSAYTAGQEFKVAGANGIIRYFTISENVESGDSAVWSDLDFLSRSYIWHKEKETAYRLYSENKTVDFVTLGAPAEEEKNNEFDYIMDFGYYDDKKLLSDTMLQALAEFQHEMPDILLAGRSAASNLMNAEQEVSRIAESNTGFLKMDVQSYGTGANGELKLILKKSSYPDGVIYRSDYNEARRNYFSWYCAEQLKDNGDPVSGIGSVVYIVHNTNPVTWEKAYVKLIDGEQKTMDYSVWDAEDPDEITLWLSASEVSGSPGANDRFYLFSTNSMSGKLGTRESELESLQQTLQQTTKVVTEEHPTYFVWDNDALPGTQAIRNGYGWCYKSYSASNNPGELYFCYGFAGEQVWRRVLIAETEPEPVNSYYFFNLKSKALYHGEGAEWVNIADTGIYINSSTYYAPVAEARRLSQSFSKVAYYCLRHDMYYKGLYDKYVYTANSALAPGNYAIKCDYGFYWVFSTDMTISANNRLWVDTNQNLVYQTEHAENVVKPEAKPYDTIDFPKYNELENVSFRQGTVDTGTGASQNSNSLYRSNNIAVYPGTVYRHDLASTSFAACYDQNGRYLEYKNLNSATFQVSERTKYIKIVCPAYEGKRLWVDDYTNKLFIKDKQYKILSPITTDGGKVGMMDLVKAFADAADACYVTSYAAYKTAQDAINEREDELKDVLGDLYREGYWQDNSYVEGDEARLYKDALDNLEKIAKPETSYEFGFLDLYGTNKDMGYAVDEDTENIEWPDIQVTDAVHLIDTDIGANCWAYIDRLEKCYDQPWKTAITINTNLSLIGQHTFTDVLTHIAEIANETKAKQTIYQRAAALTGSGAIAASKLEGSIQANKTLLLGGTSNWYTDTKGNMIFESADGSSAMMITGYGFCVASSKDQWGDWDWRSFGTGNGFTADEIIAGEMSAAHLTAGTVTTALLSATVGEDLDISSNKSLTLFATVDGSRPAGGVRTPTVNAGDSYIQIAAKNGNNPAYINIMSGGKVTLSGATMDLVSSSTMNLTSGTLNIKSGGSISMEAQSSLTLASNSTITINSGAKFILNSQNLTIDADGNATFSGTLSAASGSFTGELVAATGSFSGEITATTGKIGGWTIGASQLKSNDGKTGMSSSTSSNNDIVFWSGNSTPGSAAFRVTRGGALTATSATVSGTITAGAGSTIGGWTLTATRLYSGSGTTYVALDSGTSNVNYAIWAGSGTAANAPFSVTRNGVVTAINIAYTPTGSSTVNYMTGNSLINTVVQNGNDIASFSVKANAIGMTVSGIDLDSATGTSYISSSKLSITKDKIQMKSSGEIEIQSGGKLSIKSGSTFTVASTNFNIGSDGSVSMTGTVTATGGNIGDWNITSTSTVKRLYSQSGTDTSTYVALDAGSTGNAYKDYAIWAGATTPASAKFSVTRKGVLTATGANISGTITAGAGSSIGGWTLGANRLYSGSSSSYVALDSGTSNVDYAIWAGAETPSSASFSVKRDGTINATAGKIGGFKIGQYALGDTSQGVYLSMSPLEAARGITIDSSTTANRFAFSATMNGQVLMEHPYVLNDEGDYIDVKEKMLNAMTANKLGYIKTNRYLMIPIPLNYRGIMITIGTYYDLKGMYYITRGSSGDINATVAILDAPGVSITVSGGTLIVKCTLSGINSDQNHVVFLDINGEAGPATPVTTS